MSVDITPVQRQRAKDLIVALVSEAGGRLEGKLRLYKAFYKAHLEYFEATGRELTAYPIVHMTNGPGIDNADDLLDELEKEDRIVVLVGNGGKTREWVLQTSEGSPLAGAKAAAARSAVKWAVRRSNQELMEESHGESWQNTEPGEVMNVFTDVLPDSDGETLRQFESIFGVGAKK